MLFWLIFATMTGAAVLAVLWPLAFARASSAQASEADLAVYRDQLAEIGRDHARNLIGDREAEAAKLEVSRRILALDTGKHKETGRSDALWRRRAIAVVAMIAVPAVALGLYTSTGMPGLPDAPLAARLSSEPATSDVLILVRRIEAHLAKNPDDGRGWELLGPVYLMSGRFEDAVKARANALRILGATSAREADLGEAMVAAAEGRVTPEAIQVFDRALANEQSNSKAQFFKGLAALQAGNHAFAVSHWKSLAETASAGDPWRNEALQRMQQLERMK